MARNWPGCIYRVRRRETAPGLDALRLGRKKQRFSGTNQKPELPRPFGTGARFSKLPVITGPVKLFCFPFQMGVSKLLKIIQLSYQLKKKVDFIRGQNTPYFS